MSESAGATPVIEPGEIVGEKYRVGSMIGRGGMSVVYDATHVQLGQHVAVKVLTDHQTASRVLAEAQATARLSSEHVVRVMDVGTTQAGYGYVVMEKLTGCDLSEMIRGGKPLPLQEAVKLVLEACHGLAEAHAAGIVHRDIKPSNLFLAQKPDKTVTLKVLDFGLARAESTSATTARGSARGPRIAGSPGYASPEQLGTAADADSRADIWGLGVVLFEVVSGHRPFEATNLQDALIAAATLPMPPLESPNGPVPPGFEAVVRKCLEKDRENRYASIQDLAEALRPFAPPAFAHYVDRVRAVAGRDPFSAGTLRSMAPAGEGHTATIGTFSTDTNTDTFAGRPDSMPPRSRVLESTPPSATGTGFVVASVVSSRLAVLLAAIAVVATCLVVMLVVSRKKTEPAATKPPASAVLALPASPSALGPLPPLALPPSSAAAPEPVVNIDEVAIEKPVEKPEKTGEKTAERVPERTAEKPEKTPKPGAAKPPGGKGKTPPVASTKPAGNPMTYR